MDVPVWTPFRRVASRLRNIARPTRQHVFVFLRFQAMRGAVTSEPYAARATSCEQRSPQQEAHWQELAHWVTVDPAASFRRNSNHENTRATARRPACHRSFDRRAARCSPRRQDHLVEGALPGELAPFNLSQKATFETDRRKAREASSSRTTPRCVISAFAAAAAQQHVDAATQAG